MGSALQNCIRIGVDIVLAPSDGYVRTRQECFFKMTLPIYIESFFQIFQKSKYEMFKILICHFILAPIGLNRVANNDK